MKNFIRFSVIILLITGLFTVVQQTQADTVEAASFKDINKDAYYYLSVLELAEKGIIKGYKDETYRPERLVTRGQAAKILALSLGLDVENVVDPGFTDVKTVDDFYGPIAALAKAGIINGYADKTFKPGNGLTRAQMAKILHIGYEFQDEKLLDTKFKDVKEDAWYADFIQSLITNQITNGTSATTFSPNAFVTRGQIATFITRSEVASSLKYLTDFTTIAGNGTYTYEDGNSLEASFRAPSGIVVLDDGSVLVADSKNQLIRKIRNGEVSTFAGITLEIDNFGLPVGGYLDGEKGVSVFNLPSSLAMDGKGNVYIADTLNHAIRKISNDGQVTTFAGNGLIGDQDGTGEEARFYYPQAVTVAKDGTLYVADTLNHVIRKISVNGEVTTLNAASLRIVEMIPGEVEFAGDFNDGDLQDAKFNEPSGLVLDAKGNLYVSDSGNQLIRYIDFAANKVTTVAGDLTNAKNILQSNDLYVEGDFVNGMAQHAKFNFPKGLALTKENGLVIADSMNHSIRYLIDGRVFTLKSGEDKLNAPTDVVVDQDGNVLITDSFHHQIFQMKFQNKYVKE